MGCAGPISNGKLLNYWFSLFKLSYGVHLLALTVAIISTKQSQPLASKQDKPTRNGALNK